MLRKGHTELITQLLSSSKRRAAYRHISRFSLKHLRLLTDGVNPYPQSAGGGASGGCWAGQPAAQLRPGQPADRQPGR